MDKYLEKVEKIHIESLKTSQQEGNETFRGLKYSTHFFCSSYFIFFIINILK